MRYLRLVLRFLVFAGLTLEVVLHIFVVKHLRNASLDDILELRKRWARRVLYYTGVRLSISGTAPTQACLMVCNHRSYLDPILVIGDCSAFPVSKSELAKWPVLGWGASMAGVLFLKRNELNKRAEMLHLITDTIQNGHSVLLFPEGTTSALQGTLPFRKGGFNMAARNGLPVVPLVLHFENPADFWVTEEGFLVHASRQFLAREIRINLVYGPVFQSDDAENLKNTTRNWMEEQLQGFNPEQK
ncbi:MAG: 1-acyl-sn-glycerol-3-phosphate acyltransferase [Lewinellaceae bacterium]|nr:1-acyl-sn-glycerol-3-phosphate acyltransferase [Lewinellaceae bacterium]